MGHARFTDDGGEAALDYVVRADGHWCTTSVAIAGVYRGMQKRLSLERLDQEWHLDGQRVEGLKGAVDVDLDFTPAPKLLPLRRMAALGNRVEHARAAWLRFPAIALSALDQRFTQEEDGCITYTAEQTGFVTSLKVDSSGFVTSYPGLWTGVVAQGV